MFEDEDGGYKEPTHLPLYTKGREIFDLTSHVVELIPEDNKLLRHYKEFMMEDAAMLTVKVAGAEAADLYDIKMENAALIRKSARDLMVQCSGLAAHNFKETQYLELIRNAIEEYRLLFVEWVQSFDPWNYSIDRWGLFNPPGVNFDDHDPDDDLPPNFDGLR